VARNLSTTLPWSCLYVSCECKWA